MEITKKIFLQMVESVRGRFEEEFKVKYGVQPKMTQAFGLKGADKKKWTLKNAIERHEKTKLFLDDMNRGERAGSRFEFNPRYLYDKRLRIDKKEIPDSQSIKIYYPYDKLILLYLGFENETQYVESISDKEIKYTGYYYSYGQHEIKKFELFINFERKPNFEGVQLQEYFVKEQGFHNNPDNPVYEGYGYRLEGKLQMILWSKHDSDRLRIILESGDNAIDQKVMRGSVLAVSSGPGRPLSALELVVVREDANPSEADILRIRRYLFLHRYNFRIKTAAITLKTLSARGEGVDLMRHFLGAWRVFRYSDNYTKVISAIMWVREDYRVACFTNSYDQENFNEQVCMPNVTIDTELDTQTIFLVSYPKEGAKIISSMMLSLPRETKEKQTIDGVITFAGRHGNYPSTKGIILVRDSELEKRISQIREGKNYEQIEHVFNALREEVKLSVKDLKLGKEVSSKLYNIEKYNSGVLKKS